MSTRVLAMGLFLAAGGLLPAVAAAGPAASVDTYVQAAKLVASDGAAKSFLGSSLAVSADGSTMVVVATGATVAGHLNQGAVYVFSRPAGGWANAVQAAELTASDGLSGDDLGVFGGGVAVSADGSTVVAAAPQASVAGHQAQGAAYVFVRPGGGWSGVQHETAKLTAADGAAFDNLGFVAVSGDGSTVVAGAPLAAIGANKGQGAVYVFTRPAGGWVRENQSAKLTARDGAANDEFGATLAISADGTTFAAGAQHAAIAGRAAQGAEYVFVMPAGGWTNGSASQAAKLAAGNGAAGDSLGASTAISGDGSTVAAGALFAAVNGHSKQGASYVFVRPAGGWATVPPAAELTSSDGAAGDEMGISVGVSGDGSTVVSGSPGNHSAQGAAYAFVRPAAGWATATEAAKLTAADGAPKDALYVVAISADGGTVVAAAPDATVSGHATQGAAYVFSGSGCVGAPGTLCFDDQPGDRRWQVTATYSTTQGGGRAGTGEAISLASAGVSHGGLLWFFDSANPELLVKVVNACALNQKHWVFSSATTNVGFSLVVTDTRGGSSRTYTNHDGSAAVPIQDTGAFACTAGDAAPTSTVVPPRGAAADVASFAAACATSSTTLCIDNRFQIAVQYSTTQGGGLAGSGRPIALESLAVAQGGLFWFFAADNPEMLIKVIDGCALNQKYWVFFAAGTNVGFTVTVTDTQTGNVATYRNPDQTAASPVQDTAALPCT